MERVNPSSKTGFAEGDAFRAAARFAVVVFTGDDERVDVVADI